MTDQILADNNTSESPQVDPQNSSRRRLVGLLVIAVLLSAVGAVVMTDVGQFLKLDKSIVVGYFRFHQIIMGLSLLLFAIVVVIHRRQSVLRRRTILLVGAIILANIFVTKYAAPYVLFRSQQYRSVYKTLPEARALKYLKPEDVVYAVEHNGIARCYPREFIWQPHVFGADFGSDNLVFTYCVLSNLALPFRNDLDSRPMKLKVLAQTNNNLLLWEQNSGEVIQQINTT